MAKFLVQIVLHDAKAPKTQAGLNAAMAKQGFVRELPGKKASYVLPAGNYWFQGDGTVNDVRTAVTAVLEPTIQDFGLIVVRVDGWSVMRLKRAKVAPQE